LARQYWFFALAGLSLLMFSIDSTVVSVALPSMMGDLHTNLVWLGWTLTAYMLTQTAVMPLAGKLTESFGRMRVFLACISLFTLGSLLCGLAPTIQTLIAFRVLQALGGGGILPSAAGIVAQEFPQNRARMIGLFSSIFPIGGIVGPNLGGLIVEHWSWREVFLINVPMGVLVVAVLWRQARRSEVEPNPNHEHKSIDVLGAVLFAAAISSLLGAMSLLGEDVSFIRSPIFWALLVASGVLLVAFAWQELRAAEPVLEPRLVARTPFLFVNAYNFVFGACVFGIFSLMPYYTVVAFGLSPAESGAVLTPRSVVMMAASALSSMYLVRLGYRGPMLAGMGFLVLTLVLLSQGWSDLPIGNVHFGAFPLTAAILTLSGIGMGLAAPSSNNAILDMLPERTAVITAIRGVFRSTGGVIGTAAIVLGLELTPDKANGLRTIFLILSGLLLLTVPLTLAIPDSARARRRQPSRTRGGVEEPRVARAEP
jgi:EmrB/QacA subfamily drug resistance transporter